MKKESANCCVNVSESCSQSCIFICLKTEQAFLNHLFNHLPKRKKRGKQYGKGNDNNFFSLIKCDYLRIVGMLKTLVFFMIIKFTKFILHNKIT
jgi:hypothetical protein